MPKQNLLLQSQTFDNASWTKSSASISANAVAAPDGTLTADKLIEDGTTATHRVIQTITTGNRDGTFSVYLKAAERTWAYVEFFGRIPTDTSIAAATWVDLATGTLSLGGAGEHASIDSVGNGWYRVSVNFKGNVSTLGSIQRQCNVSCTTGNGVQSYAGNGTSGIYIWGAQYVFANHPGEYTPTTTVAIDTGSPRNKPQAQNLILQSQSFDHASWSKAGIVNPVVANTVTAPDGTLTADTIDFTGSVAGAVIYQSVATTLLPAAPGRICTSSIWLRASAPTTVNLTGTAIITPTICAVTTTWKQFTLAELPTQLGIALRNNAAGTSGIIYAWGAQVNVGNVPAIYAATTTTVVNIGAPRNISAQGQNLLLHSEDFSQASWTKQTNVTVTTNQAANPANGALTADLVDWSLASTTTGLFQSTTTGITAPNPYTRSIWVRTVSGTGTVSLLEAVSGNVVALDHGLIDTTWRRLRSTYNAASTSHSLWLAKGASCPNVYIWGAQLNQGMTPTPYQATTSAVVNAGVPRINAHVKQNLLLQSAAFGTSPWSTSQATIVANSTTDPFGGSTADTLVDTVANAGHTVLQGITTALGQICTVSVFAKAGTKSHLIIVPLDASPKAYFNLSTGALGTMSGTQAITSKIESYGSGWYRCSFTFRVDATNNVRFYLSGADSVQVYLGDGTGTIYLFGAQVDIGNHPRPYVATTTAAIDTAIGSRIDTQIAQNLFLQSNTFDHASWTKQANCNVTANQATAPDGTLTADLFDFTTAGSEFGVYQAPSATKEVGRWYTRSVWMRAVTGTTSVQLTGVGISARVSCALTTTWQRFSITEQASASVDHGLAIRNLAAGSSGQFYVWGAQCNLGTAAAPYSATTTAANNLTQASRSAA